MKLGRVNSAWVQRFHVDREEPQEVRRLKDRAIHGHISDGDGQVHGDLSPGRGVIEQWVSDAYRETDRLMRLAGLRNGGGS